MSLHDEPLSPESTAALLHDVLARATEHAPEAIVVFDLDSTLLDNSPRQSLIMREYGQQHGVEALAENQPQHWAGWDGRIAMRNSGLEESLVQRHAVPFKDFWADRFFTSEYCTHDELVPGADAYTTALVPTGSRIFYVTGRHEPMRDGTLQCLDRLGCPVPDGSSVELIMKPTLDETDDDYKRRAYETLRARGLVIAAFDNEPTHINGYKDAFPDALSIHLATDHSLRSVPVDKGIPSIRDFSPFRSPRPAPL